MLQNEGLDGKKNKQYATSALDSTSPKEREGKEGGEAHGWDSQHKPNSSFSQILHHISLSTHTSGGIAKPVAFYWCQALCHSFTVLEAFKGPKNNGSTLF